MRTTGIDGALDRPLTGGGAGLPKVPDLVEVVVPVHDEAELLPRCLRGLATACRHARLAGIRARVTVVLDACSDGSLELVTAAGLTSVRIDARNVGRARAAGFAWVLTGDAPPTARAGGEAPVALDRVWLATTDADSVVPPDWLTRQVARARAGADMVLGTVGVDDWSDWPAATAREYLARYRAFPAGTPHPHVHGANLGIRATTYRAVGGFAPLATAEDHALVARVEAAGGRIVRVGDSPVRTSARVRARAPHGFSEHLHRLTEPG